MNLRLRRRDNLGEAVPPPDKEVGSAGRLAWLLTVCCVAQFMVILDLSIVNVALPSIQLSLGFSAIDLQWVVDAYSILFAGFLMLGGRASDRFGSRRVLITALLVFAAASLIGGSAPDQIVLVLARGLQGLSGALMAAGSLAAITSSFPPGPARHRAIGLWGAMNGAGGAAGSLFGGIITQELGWRWVLLINPPIGVATAIVAFVVVVERNGARRSEGSFDLAGALSLTGGLVVLVYGIVNAGYLGWLAPLSLAPILVGLALLGSFPMIELRAKAPLVPLRAFSGQLRKANIIVLIFSAALFPMWYVSSLYLQQVLGLSPLDAGLAFLPMALVIMFAARRAGSAVNRFGVRPVLGAGLLLMAGGLLLFARIGSSGSAIGFVILPGLLVALGIGFSIVPSTIAAVQGVAPEKGGLASGFVNTSRQVGGALGIAILISLATSYTSHLIGANRAVPDALTDGFRLAYLICAGLCALAGVATFAWLPRPVANRRFVVPSALVVILACFAAVDFATAGGAGAPIGTYTTKGAYSFVSAPNLHPPKITTDAPTRTGLLSPGYIMLANFYDLTTKPMVGQSGPLILDNSLQPVWFRPVPTKIVASNLSVQSYNGHPALAWWQGIVSNTGATESGSYTVVNQHYQTIATLHGADNWILTLHSFQIVGDDAWVTANRNVPMDLTKYGGSKDGALTDSAVQEYDLSTGKLLYSWDALQHIPLSDSEASPPTNSFPWDAYHVNSISLQGSARFLVSMRNTWAAYDVDRSTGHILWTLGGKHSSFTLKKDALFQWQHDVVADGATKVTMFDDDCCQITGAGTYLAAAGPSRGLVLKLDRNNHTASILHEYPHDPNLESSYMGSVELLANGNVFVGWGAEPYFSEYTGSGRLLLDGVLPNPDLSYRATLHNWVGLPLTAPSAALRRSGGAATIYASWNGATKVASWRVLAADGSQVVKTVKRSGFETAITLHHVSGESLKVQALDVSGHVLGTSHELH
ncbi:MAG: MFS transporter [Acidimicrobiales bacterium]